MREGPTGQEGRILFAFLLGIFLLLSHGYIENPDAEVEYQTARSLVLRGHAGLSKDGVDASAAEVLLLSAPRPFDVMRGRDGRWYSWFGIGHALVLAPFYLAGRGMALLLPSVEKTYLENCRAEPGGRSPAVAAALGEEFWSRLLVSLHSPLFGALAGWMLYRLLGRLGFGKHVRIPACLLALLGTQFGPETRESMADTTTAFFLFAAVEALLVPSGGTRTLVRGGLAAGMAVLCRPFLVLSLIPIGIFLLLRERREKAALRDFLVFGAVLLPFGLFQLWFDYARFGDPFEMGYSAGTSEGYWSFPPLLGFFLLGFSPGKGLFWFSPLLWAVPYLYWKHRKGRGPILVLFLGLLLVPWILASFTAGWHSSQAWGVRYLSAGAVLVVASALAMAFDRDLRGSPRLRRVLFGLAGIGLLVQAGGWLTPYHGYYDLAFRAAAVRWADVPEGDRIHYLASDPRTSPLHGHWTYAWFNATGEIPSGSGRKVYGALFGEDLDSPPVPNLPEDRSFRHFWALGLGRRLDSVFPAVLGLLLLVLTVRAGRDLRRSLADSSTGSDPIRR